VKVRGLLLAAGAGSRMGRPKALVSDAAGPWLTRSLHTLLSGGCDGVTVVLGAGAEQARALLAADVSASGVNAVVAPDWAEGMSASLRAGLGALEGTTADAALVHLVDLPDVGANVIARVTARAIGGSAGPSAQNRLVLARAGYHARPGHPVLIGRDHWAPLMAGLHGDRGARDYLASQQATVIECGDLATGIDADVPTALGRPHFSTD
jgi:CTP:molybdopterin cytidylyltransferase MocA